MANTTNFGWETPDDTDLVKDGAASIRTLGSAIDTSLVDLKGGTTGQVLSKASGTDLDYSWTTIAAGSMTLITSGTFSNNASVVLNSISGSYRDLVLRVYDFRPATDGEQLYIRLNADTGSNYYVALTTPGDNSSQSAQSRFRFFGDTDNGAATTGAGILTIMNYASSTTKKLLDASSTSSNSSTATNQIMEQKNGLYNSTTAITSLTMLTGGGNITSGSYELLGVN